MKSKSKKPTQVGENRTGTAVAPAQSKRTEEGAAEANVLPDGFTDLHAALVEAYAEEQEPIGTMPPPTTVKGVAGAAKDLVSGTRQNVLLDLVGERIAFERTGTRLYDQLLLKFDLFGTWDGGPSRDDLRRHRDEELRHFELLVDAMRQLGGDPTAMTPSADVAAVEASGILAVVSDARTTLAQATHALHAAELVDRDSWSLLCEVAEKLGHGELASRFRQACQDEERHLRDVRAWTRSFALLEAGAESRSAAA